MLVHSSRGKKTYVKRPATVAVVKPVDKKKEEPTLDLSKASITVIKPDAGLQVLVEENKKESK